MVNEYLSLVDEDGNYIKGLTILFVTETNEDGEIINFKSGVGYVPEQKGQLFIVNDWLIDQVEKLKLIDGNLVEKEDNPITTPRETEIEVKRRELLKQLEELEKVSEKPTE